MALTIIATVGSASANAFVTEAEQVTYMAARLNASAWTTVSGATLTETEKAAVIEATRDLSAMRWKGKRVDAVQALSWPRQWAIDPDSPIQDYFDTDVIPQRVKDACAELAFQYLKEGTTDLAAADPNAGITSETVGPISTSYDIARRPVGLARYDRILRWITPLLAGSTARIVRG